MYYVYERIWASVTWGRSSGPSQMSGKEKLLWTLGTAAALGLIFFLLLEVHPKIKAKQSPSKTVETFSNNVSNELYLVDNLPMFYLKNYSR